jgi:hypothetical protein
MIACCIGTENWFTFLTPFAPFTNRILLILFCSKFQLPIEVIMKVNRTNLASEVLNDLSFEHFFGNNKFVINKVNRQILGVVSNTYVPYSNRQFYSDLMYVLGYQFDS